jgi:hypothetical protein
VSRARRDLDVFSTNQETYLYYHENVNGMALVNSSTFPPIRRLVDKSRQDFLCGVSPADVNSDGLMDLVAPSASYTNGLIKLYRNGYCEAPRACHDGGVCRTHSFRPK